MKSFTITTYPDKCLRQKTVEVVDFDDALREIVDAMADSMHENEGIGLAAPQVGLGLSIVVIDAGEGVKAFINPRVVKSSQEKDTVEEGCLSLPGIGVTVSRPTEVEIEARDKAGNMVNASFDGLEAKAIQHEIDHLNGRLIIDHMNPLARLITSWKLKRQKGSA